MHGDDGNDDGGDDDDDENDGGGDGDGGDHGRSHAHGDVAIRMMGAVLLAQVCKMMQILQAVCVFIALRPH